MVHNKNFNESTLKLLNNIIQKNRMAIFPTPDKIKDHIEVIKKMISSISETTLAHNSNVSLSAQAIHHKDKF